MEFIDDGLSTKLVFKEDVKEAAGDESREGWRGVGAPKELSDQARRGCHAAVKEASGGTDGVLDFMVKCPSEGCPRHVSRSVNWHRSGSGLRTC